MKPTSVPMFQEHDVVILNTIIPGEPLVGPGSGGTIINYNPAFPKDYLVEFSGKNGVPYAELWLSEDQLFLLREEPIQA